MKPYSQIIDFYYSNLSRDLKKLEQDRVKIKKRVITYSIYSFVGITIASAIFVKTTNKELEWIDGIVFMVMNAVVFAFFYHKFSKDYVQEFKLKIIAPMISYIDESLTYIPFGFIPKENFLASGLIRDRIDRYSGDDLVQGKISDVEIEFCDLLVEKKEKNTKKSGEYYTLFRGVFFHAKFPKRFFSKLLVVSDNSEKILGSYLARLLQSLSSDEKKLYHLDHPEFEKYFAVYGSDPIEARYILSHTFMDQLVAFRKKVGHDVSISFSDQKIYIAIDYNKNSLEASIFKSLLEYKTVQQYVQTIYLMLEIVEKLSLNKNLWRER